MRALVGRGGGLVVGGLRLGGGGGRPGQRCRRRRRRGRRRLAVGLDDEVLAWRRWERVEQQVLAGRSATTRWPARCAPRGPRPGPTGDGARGRRHGGLADQPERVAPAVTTTMPRAPASAARRSASDSGVGGDGMAGGSGRGRWRPGSRCRSRPQRTLARPDPDERGEQRHPRPRRPGRGVRSRRVAQHEGQPGRPRRARRPRGDHRAGRGAAGHPPHDARSTQPPSSGRPGSRLKTPTSRLLTVRAGSRRATVRVESSAGRRQRPRRAPGDRGAGGGDEASRPGSWTPFDLGDAAEEVQPDRRDRQPGLRGQGVAELVDQHGGVEQDREGEGDRVAQSPMPGTSSGPRREQQGDQAGDQEPGGRHVDRDAERPGHDDAAVAHAPASGSLHAASRCPGAAASVPVAAESGSPSVDTWAGPPEVRGPGRRTEREPPDRVPCRRRRPATSAYPCCTGSGVIDRLPEGPARPPPAAPWCTPCSSGCSTCPPPSARRRAARRWWCPSGSACSTPSPSSPSCSHADGPRTRRDGRGWPGPRELLDAYFELEDPPARAGRARALRRDDPGVGPAAARLRRPARRRAERRACGRLQDRQGAARGLRGQGDVPDAVLRPGAVAAARRVPRLLQLLYLGSGEVLRYEPDEADLRATERKVEAIWAAIRRATESGDWRPNPTGCATGATTRPCAPPSAARPPPPAMGCCRRRPSGRHPAAAPARVRPAPGGTRPGRRG